MYLSLNEIDLMTEGTLLEHIAACGRNGIPYLEIRKPMLLAHFRDGGTLEDVRNALREAGVKVSSLNSVESISFNGKRARRLLLEGAEYLFFCAREIGAPVVELVTSFKVETEDQALIHEETVSIIKELAALARPYGIRLALEYMGLPDCSVKTFSQAAAIVREVREAGYDNAGLLMDTWHHFAWRSEPDEIRRMPGLINLAHISDCPAKPVGELLRPESYLPGAGEAPLQEIIDALKDSGYDYVLSAEIMDPAFKALPVDEKLQQIRKTVEPFLY